MLSTRCRKNACSLLKKAGLLTLAFVSSSHSLYALLNSEKQGSNKGNEKNQALQRQILCLQQQKIKIASMILKMQNKAKFFEA